MASPSPSEFLTFYRAIRSAKTLSRTASRSLARPSAVSRPFTTSIQRHKDDIGPNKDHTLDKVKDDPNVQSHESGKGKE